MALDARLAEYVDKRKKKKGKKRGGGYPLQTGGMEVSSVAT